MASNNTGQGLETRFALVRAFFIEREVKHYMSVFAAFGCEIDEHKDKITAWWNGRARITPEDESTLVAMEGVVERLKNEPEVAA